MARSMGPWAGLSRGLTLGLPEPMARSETAASCERSYARFCCLVAGVSFALTLIFLPGLGQADTVPAELRTTVGRPPRPLTVRVVVEGESVHVVAQAGASRVDTTLP